MVVYGYQNSHPRNVNMSIPSNIILISVLILCGSIASSFTCIKHADKILHPFNIVMVVVTIAQILAICYALLNMESVQHVYWYIILYAVILFCTPLLLFFIAIGAIILKWELDAIKNPTTMRNEDDWVCVKFNNIWFRNKLRNTYCGSGSFV